MKLNLHGLKPLIAPRDPVLPAEVTPKSYVDNLVDQHASDESLHLGVGQRDLLDGIEVTAEDINTLAGAAAGGGIQAQIAAKLEKAGDTMTGPLTLPGAPSENLHAATKGYVDQRDALKLDKAGGTLTGPLVLSADPEANMQAATKQYVDASIVDHANDDSLHLTLAQNEWIDAITASSTEVNALVGVTAGVQSQIDSKFDKAGGSITGDVTMAAGRTIHVSKVPVQDTDVTNKAYVDSAVRGQEWKNPITDPNLLNLSVDSADSLVAGMVYVVSANPTDARLEGKEGYAFRVEEDGEVVFLQSRAIIAGDRFGVNLGGQGSVVGALSTGDGKIATIVNATPGAMSVEFTEPTARQTTVVFDADSKHFGETWTFSDEGVWVVTNVSVNLSEGAGISIDESSISVKVGTGLKIDGNGDVALAVSQSAPVHVNAQGDLTLRYTNTELSVTDKGNGPQLGLHEDLVNRISDNLSKSNGGTVTAPVVFGSNATVSLGATATEAAHAVNKGYVDQATSVLGEDVEGLDERLQALEADPVTKNYTDLGLNTKLSKAGGEMTGALLLHAAPTSNMQAANKQYVDANLSSHINNQDVHLTAEQNELLDALIVTSEEVNALAGVEDNVQDQLDGTVKLAGSTMTGSLQLAANPVGNLEAATKQYVDAVDNAKLNKAGGTMTGPIVLPGAPTEALQATTKGYVDNSIADARETAADATALKVSKAGDTMTGPLTLPGAPTEALHAATKGYSDARLLEAKNYADGLENAQNLVIDDITSRVEALETDPTDKQYVDDQLALKLDKSGGAMTGYLSLHANPTQNGHAVNKQYVDAVAQGLSVRPQVRLASTGNIAGTYENGSFGVNSTLTGAANGALMVDGTAARVGDRILLKDQTNKAQNGDYVVQQVGDGSSPFILKRTVTMDESHEVPSSYFYIYDGATLKGTGWSLVVDSPITFSIGNDDINVFQFSGQGSMIAGDGVVLNGNTLNVQTANPARIVVNADDIDLATTGVAPGQYTKVTVDGYGRVLSAANPTTLAGYAISDAQPLNANLTAISAVTGGGLLARNLAGEMSVRTVSHAGDGITVENGDLASSGNIVIRSNATSAATASTIVARDGNGNFSANTITATLVGNASSATVLKDTRTISISGDGAATGTFNGAADLELEFELADTGVVAGEYTKVTVDSKGRVTEGENPTTLAGYGITDAYTKQELEARILELEQKVESLYLYIVGRI